MYPNNMNELNEWVNQYHERQRNFNLRLNLIKSKKKLFKKSFNGLTLTELMERHCGCDDPYVQGVGKNEWICMNCPNTYFEYYEGKYYLNGNIVTLEI